MKVIIKLPPIKVKNSVDFIHKYPEDYGQYSRLKGASPIGGA